MMRHLSVENEPSRAIAHGHLAAGQPAATHRGMRGVTHERAQSTVEYAILLLGAAAVAMLVIAWVSKSDVIGRLFETVFDRIISQT